eukprot:TRINITY_DN38177_c0_g1_i1.p1 TRINITY_DN38177_c0_g1~~TRINITY_DN38177_c0_g1_i1.p1  ORF type:complete len:241 (+),score=46.75 TRINITY_DN38177_c0_g1_i1:33-725(+)
MQVPHLVPFAAWALLLESFPEHASASCLCVFDIDRTLTGRQGDTSACPRDLVVAGVHDSSYQGGVLTLSELGQSVDSTFCKDCFLGTVSAGVASGPNSAERAKLEEMLPADRRFNAPFLDNCPSPVTSPLVLGCPDGHKQDAVQQIVTWYQSKGVAIAGADVHFFDDRASNVQPFDGSGFNAHQISCKSRDANGIGLCGATLDEVVADVGVKLCSGGLGDEDASHEAVVI